MRQVSSFNDYFLLKAASQYVYEMSYFPIYKDPVLTVKMNLKNDFLGRYTIERCENDVFERDGKRINLRYILFKDTLTHECALVYQGSTGEVSEMFSGEDNDWSNNLNIVAQLPLDNYDLAKAEFEYLQSEGYKITAVAGNSLGGGYALYVADHYEDVRAIGLNPAPREHTTRYKENANACIVVTSSDILSRTLSLDISRLKGEQSVSYQKNRSVIERMEDAYGVKVYVIQRSIPYTSGKNISIGHVGAMRNYREILLQLYNENFLYYNATIIREHKEWKSFSKYLLQTAYKKLDQGDYRLFTEEYIYPSLTKSAKQIVDTYKFYPQIEDFTSFDLKSMNLMTDEGESILPQDFIIEDDFNFANNFNAINNGYNKTMMFYINNSLAELKSVFEEDSFGYSKKQFISSSLKLAVDWDWMFAKIFIDMPLPVKLKTGEFLEQNIGFVYRLNNKLSEEYRIKERFSESEISEYVNELITAFERLTLLHHEIVTLSDSISANLELMLIESKGRSYVKESLYEEPSKPKSIDLSDLKHLDKHIMHYHFEAAKETLKNNSDFVEKNVVDISSSLTEVLEVILTGLESEKEKRDDQRVNKLHKQTSALLENVDLKSFLVMALYEYQDDLVVYLLRDSVAITFQYNLIQMIEANAQYRKQIKNIKHYLHWSILASQAEIISKDVEMLEKLIDEEDKHLKNILF